MRIAVAGGLGHIGSRLIRVLPGLCPESEITIIDNFKTQRYCSLFNLDGNYKYRFIDGDIMSDNIENLINEVDVVVNLAANTEPGKSIENEEEVERINYFGAKNIANACAEKGIKLIFPSSTSVYSSEKKHMYEDENLSLDTAQTPYAKSKIEAEECLNELGDIKGLKYTVLRLGTIFGISPGMRFHTAVNKFTYNACLNNSVTVWETALNQKRPYLDIEDAVRAISFIISNDYFGGETYNVSTLSATVGDIVDIIKTNIPNISIHKESSAIMNTLSYDAPSKKIIDRGFVFEGSLERGIRDTIQLLKGINND